MKNVDVFYNYDEERCFLNVHHDAENNTVVIRGGMHAFARLAELFAIYSVKDSVPDTDEHDHWNLLRGETREFIINARPFLQNGNRPEE